ncbi:filamentous hemagglutinin N-terminal domain-containing protein [Bordetella avium]|uniref:filamentous hemagglutinin N-terminal domain-containing protein n=2 Tax=Bordetella avium TaxID=521 RepID=UPI00146A3195|nr:filamentous hemagglutinin N-terminal domain-containing protein [Bordetella avium]
MNKHCYRLRWSHHARQCVPIAEILCSVGASGRRSGRRQRWRLLPLAASLVFAGLDSALAQQLAADGRVSIDTAPNGVAVIAIAPPDAQGVSRNPFPSFDTRQPGAVFNNSTRDGRSQLAGQLLRNPRLSGGPSAALILAEVQGLAPSHLSGALEVFGPRAALVIANPNGIQADGLSTINVSALTLSTGRVLEGAPRLLLDVRQGEVTLGAQGVNTDGLAAFDVVAHTIRVQGAIAPGLGRRARRAAATSGREPLRCGSAGGHAPDAGDGNAGLDRRLGAGRHARGLHPLARQRLGRRGAHARGAGLGPGPHRAGRRPGQPAHKRRAGRDPCPGGPGPGVGRSR